LDLGGQASSRVSQGVAGDAADIVSSHGVLENQYWVQGSKKSFGYVFVQTRRTEQQASAW
ncbi:MAG: hypothetical protein Q7U14_06260, partial [Lacisediminimonas sp.]|nr:hypothetical protein [Lacisediminimonas sp.]